MSMPFCPSCGKEAPQETKYCPFCCESLFDGFTFAELTLANPPPKKGVYVLRIKTRTEETPRSIVRKVGQLASDIGWKLVEDYVMSRMKRLEEIGLCPIIYIGSAGTQRTSKNTLKHRYEELSNRHTVMYPVWALLYSGWKLEYGWKSCDDPSAEEKMYKKKYRALHGNQNPALVKK